LDMELEKTINFLELFLLFVLKTIEMNIIVIPHIDL
jgi:hypothetical protein